MVLGQTEMSGPYYFVRTSMYDPLKDIKECIRMSTHLTSCDDDGFCNFCGYQEGWDYEADDWLPEYINDED